MCHFCTQNPSKGLLRTSTCKDTVTLYKDSEQNMVHKHLAADTYGWKPVASSLLMSASRCHLLHMQ